VLLTAFSTASSSATLPVTLDTVQEQAGVSRRVSSFTLPLGATVNMDGTALYECVVVIFLAQIYGVLGGFELSLMQQFSVAMLALLTSVGVAGIPSASLVAIVVILGVVGLPPEAVGLVWVTDRILDMCRTAVNVFSDTCGAVIIARTEGEPVYPDAVG
jgi:Na+/H+-dicarboxylate symporter